MVINGGPTVLIPRKCNEDRPFWNMTHTVWIGGEEEEEECGVKYCETRKRIHKYKLLQCHGDAGWVGRSGL